MSGHIVRYLVYVRVCYLLLGWWYLTLTACSQLITGKPRKERDTMSKNMTRKSLAVGAASALIISGFAGVPANAAGLDQGYVSLAPNSGTAYAVLTDGTFDLKANYASSLTTSGRQLKFLVTDPDAQLRMDVDVNGATADAVYGADVAISAATTPSGDATVTVTAAGHRFTTGDVVSFLGSTAFVGSDGAATNFKTTTAGFAVTVVDVNSFTFESPATNETGVTVTGAKAGFLATSASAATVASNVVTITVANGTHFLPGDIVTLGGTTFNDSAAADKKATDVTLTAVSGNTLTGALTAANGAMSLSAAIVTMKTEITTTTLLSRATIVDKDLGHFRILGATDADVAVSARAVDNSFVVETIDNDITNDMVLRLVNTDGTETYSATVTAWVDNNDNNLIDSTEQASPTRTVTFYDESDLTVVTAVDGPVLGALGATGSISISPELNGQQVGNNAAQVTSTWTLQTSTVNTNTATYNTVTKVWDVAMDLNSTDTIAVGTYSLRASVNAIAVGNTVSVLVQTRTSADTTAVVATTDDTTYMKSDSAATTITNVVSNVRVGKSAVVTMTALDSAGVAVGAGKSVTVQLRTATTTTDWTINAVKVLDNAASGTKYYTTDANGQVVLTVSSTAGANADSIDIHFSPENVAATDNAANAEVRLTWATASYAIVDLNAPVNGTARTLSSNGTISFDLFAGDQWNAPLVGDYRVQMSASGRADGTTTVGFANGRGTYTLTDAALGAGSTITVATQLQKLTAAVWGNSVAATDLSDITVTVSNAPATSVVVATAKTNGNSVADADALGLSTIALVDYDAQTTQGSYTDPTPASSDTNFVALGAGTGISAGDTVTVSGAGLAFGYYDNSATPKIIKVGVGSLTFVLDDAADKIAVLSNVYAKNAVVTVSARGRSGTTLVSTAVAGATSGTSIAVTAPAAVSPGSTFQVTATLTDAYGNVVAVPTAGDAAVTYDGPGIIFGTLPDKFDANGQMKFAVLLGANDSGTATVTVSYDQNSDDDFTGVALGDLDVVVVKTVVVGTVASATKVNAGSFKGYVALYAKGYKGQRMSAKVGKDWVVVASLASDFERVVEFTGAGVDVAVRIYIDRVLLDTINLTTK